jgi:TonB family protein
LDHVKTNGTDSSTMLGKKGIIPTDEQLKHQRYAEKISWCLQQSFKQNHARLADYHQAVVEVYLALNKNGSINQVSIAKSSGKPRVDQFVLFTFQDAQSSFPPVPEYFHEDPYKIVYIIQVETMMR